MYQYYTKPIIFDRQNGYFYTGKPKMLYGLIDPTDKSVIPLSSIRTLQIIPEKVSTRNSNFLSYEINLVLDNKKRINIVDYSDLSKIQADSKLLWEYLWVPVWGM